jgi:hypothetical protein
MECAAAAAGGRAAAHRVTRLPQSSYEIEATALCPIPLAPPLGADEEERKRGEERRREEEKKGREEDRGREEEKKGREDRTVSENVLHC